MGGGSNAQNIELRQDSRVPTEVAVDVAGTTVCLSVESDQEQYVLAALASLKRLSGSKTPLT